MGREREREERVRDERERAQRTAAQNGGLFYRRHHIRGDWGVFTA